MLYTYGGIVIVMAIALLYWVTEALLPVVDDIWARREERRRKAEADRLAEERAELSLDRRVEIRKIREDLTRHRKRYPEG